MEICNVQLVDSKDDGMRTAERREHAAVVIYLRKGCMGQVYEEMFTYTERTKM